MKTKTSIEEEEGVKREREGVKREREAMTKVTEEKEMGLNINTAQDAEMK